MKILPKILALLVFMLPLGAESLPVVTLDEAIASAEENNIGLKQAAITLNQTIRNENNYVSTYLPTFGLSATAGTGVSFPNQGTLTATDKTTFNGVDLDLGASLNFSYALTGSKITDGESRRLSKESATIDYQSNVSSLESNVIKAYWNLAALDIAIKNAELSVSDAQSSYDSVAEMYNSGMTDELSLTQAELALNQAIYTLQTYKDQKALALASFRALTGIEGDFQTEMLPETVMLQLPSPAELYDIYAEDTTDIRSARNALATAKTAEKTATLSQYMPTVTANINYTYGGGLSSKASLTASAGEYTTSAHNLSGTVAVNIPLSSYIPGSTADETRKNASDAVSIAALSLSNTQNTLLQTIESNAMSISQQQQLLSMAESSLILAENTYSLAEEAFEAGLMSAYDLSARRSDLLSAQMSETSARLNHLLSSYDLAFTLGIELQDLQEQYAIKETV